MTEPLKVTIEPTPNPNSVKLTLNRVLVEKGSRSFTSKQAAEVDPLAKALFTIPGVTMVFMMNNFISVMRDPSANWNKLLPEVEKKIQARLTQDS